ncbi:MAG: TAT-variant-translocated molybdopterin oxidoreductase [Candidatus Latescibacterota bacterium]|nr:TAT-variant-translocated molybdopterin oxidoreductase [Candidatus Latescibacterota bacterium]
MTDKTTMRKDLGGQEISRQLKNSSSQTYWSSLEDLSRTDEFVEMVGREFPEQADQLMDSESRRNFLKLMGASFALGGLSACTIQPQEKIVPQVRAPEELIPGKPSYFASAYPDHGYGFGVLVESHMGRPTRVDGNVAHPASLGGSSSAMQASILDLYDPDRLQTITNAGRLSTPSVFWEQLDKQLNVHSMQDGQSLRVLMQTSTSPTEADLLSAIQSRYPGFKWHQFEPHNRDNYFEGSDIAFGKHLNCDYDFSKAKVIFSFDSDFTRKGSTNARYAKQFSAARKVRDGQSSMNRLYMAEPSPTSTGSLADHRWAMNSASMEVLALQIARALNVSFTSRGKSENALPTEMVRAIADDLFANKGKSLVIAGESCSPELHALVHAINNKLKNVGSTVFYRTPVEISSESQKTSFGELIKDMNNGDVKSLIVLGGNPLFHAPVDSGFADAFSKVDFRVHLTSHVNDTSEHCHWQVASSHYLEAWGDIRAFDGTVSIIQPLIKPLYKSISRLELLGFMAGKAGLSGIELVKRHWETHTLEANFATFWRKTLHDGVMANTKFDELTPKINNLRLSDHFGILLEEDLVELQLRPDPMIDDGRFSNNGWLQESPRPISKLTWDNAAIVSPKTAERLRLKSNHMADLRLGDLSLKLPVWVLPGQAENVITVHTGFGQQGFGRVSNGSGFNAYLLATTSNPDGNVGLKVIASFDKYELACTQEHSKMTDGYERIDELGTATFEDRKLIRESTFKEYKRNPDFAHEGVHDPPDDMTLYNRSDHEYDGYAWGMVVDLGVCGGCNVCAIACQSENNIPVVGKEQVLNGRELSWIRIDRYYKGEIENPRIVHQPVTCMHCENAPCEVVCPVAATVHSKEGLNDMIYNRCVGTRYCANNCPYKVRRFNFLQYANRTSESLKLQRNPDVTVRSRGVMEKCTYCVQRINQARIESKKSGIPIKDGQIQTACQQACPSDAIIFGDINDPASQVSKYKASKLNYGILTDLNTRPRTTYLAAVRNPNPSIEV